MSSDILPPENEVITSSVRGDPGGPAPGELEYKRYVVAAGTVALQRRVLDDFFYVRKQVKKTKGKCYLAQAKLDCQWVLSENCDAPFSFVRCCEACGLDPSAVRKALENGVDLDMVQVVKGWKKWKKARHG